VFSAQVVIVRPEGGLALYKTADWTNAPAPIQAGGQIDYQIKIANDTNQTLLAGARITDFLPPNTTYLAASSQPALELRPQSAGVESGTNTADIPGVVSSLTTNTFSATTNTFDTYSMSPTRIKFRRRHKPGRQRQQRSRTKTAGALRPVVHSHQWIRLERPADPDQNWRHGDRRQNVGVYRLTNGWTENTLNNAKGEASGTGAQQV